MKGIFVLLVSVAMLGLTSAAYGGSPRSGGRLLTQRNETPPAWSVGKWSGHDEVTNADYELTISDDGRSNLVIRRSRDTQTQRGGFRSGKLDLNGDIYLLRQIRGDIGLTLQGSRKDYILLRKAGSRPAEGDELSVTDPQNNQRFPLGPVFLRGNCNYSEVQIEIRRGADRIQDNRVSTRSGRWELRVNLAAGHYEATIRGGDRGRSIERKVSFNVGGMGRTMIESPQAGAQLAGGDVTISGTSQAPDVEIEVYRGHDRVFIQQMPVRDGRFLVRTRLSWGTFVLTVRGKENGATVGTDRRGFEVMDTATRPQSNDLRLDKPGNGARFRGEVVFEGSAGGNKIRVQVYRGKDRIYNELTDVKDGHFRARVQLDRGHYDGIVMSERDGRVLSTRRVSFDIDD